MPLARGVLVVIVEVGYGGAVEVIASPAGNRTPGSELSRLQSRAFAVPNEIFRMACRACIAAPVVYIAPIVELCGVDAQEVVRGEEFATEGAIEGLLVLGVVVLSGEETEVVQKASVALRGIFLDDFSLVALERVAIGVDSLPSQVTSPNLEELIAVGVGESRPQSCQSHLFLCSTEGQNFNRHLGCLFAVLPSSLLHESALNRIGFHTSHLGESTCCW